MEWRAVTTHSSYLLCCKSKQHEWKRLCKRPPKEASAATAHLLYENHPLGTEML